MIAHDDHDKSAISFIRRGHKGREIVVVCNFCPVMRKNYKIGVPEGEHKVVLSSDSARYGGTGTRIGRRKTKKIPMHGFDQSISVTLPPLSTVYYVKVVNK